MAYVQDSVFLVAETLNKIHNDCESFQDLDICGKEELTPADFTAALRATEFDGLSGRVTFSGNDRVCIICCLLNFSSEFHRLSIPTERRFSDSGKLYRRNKRHIRRRSFDI